MLDTNQRPEDDMTADELDAFMEWIQTGNLNGLMDLLDDEPAEDIDGHLLLPLERS